MVAAPRNLDLVRCRRGVALLRASAPGLNRSHRNRSSRCRCTWRRCALAPLALTEPLIADPVAIAVCTPLFAAGTQGAVIASTRPLAGARGANQTGRARLVSVVALRAKATLAESAVRRAIHAILALIRDGAAADVLERAVTDESHFARWIGARVDAAEGSMLPHLTKLRACAGHPPPIPAHSVIVRLRAALHGYATGAVFVVVFALAIRFGIAARLGQHEGSAAKQRARAPIRQPPKAHCRLGCSTPASQGSPVGCRSLMHFCGSLKEQARSRHGHSFSRRATL